MSANGNNLDAFKTNQETKEIDTTKKIRVGIIGTGWIADSHILSYLKCPDVEIVAVWKVYNVKTVNLENAIHHLFDKVQLQLTAGGYTPKEWYVVPLDIVDDAINILMSGKKVAYDDSLQQLITEE